MFMHQLMESYCKVLLFCVFTWRKLFSFSFEMKVLYGEQTLALTRNLNVFTPLSLCSAFSIFFCKFGDLDMRVMPPKITNTA